MRDLAILFRKSNFTSVELVDLLNSLRSDGEPRLRHDHFMTKVEKVLGSSQYNQIKASGHIFQRREACLMVMSYGYDLQAMVFELLMARR